MPKELDPRVVADNMTEALDMGFSEEDLDEETGSPKPEALKRFRRENGIPEEGYKPENSESSKSQTEKE